MSITGNSTSNPYSSVSDLLSNVRNFKIIELRNYLRYHTASNKVVNACFSFEGGRTICKCVLLNRDEN
ncbi:hypothetical protein HD806DRAFT_483055 [Xylariaceae sp. AK1471]|nr:hypothetical protein HD806DRAFT_483055 [Xylariaceae sp. AK1471]